MNRRSILKMLALAVIDPEVLIWTPGKKVVIEGPRYTFNQYQQWCRFDENKRMWLETINHNQYGDLFLQAYPDIYERIAAGDRRAKELGIVQ